MKRVPGGRFNVYVAQPEVKPGCVVRQSNVNLLEKKKLVTDKEVTPITAATKLIQPKVCMVFHLV